MSQDVIEDRPPAVSHRPIKAWILAAVLFVFGVRLLAARDR